jgi:hypothetical protein
VGASGGKERIRAVILSACLRNGYQGNVVADFVIGQRPEVPRGWNRVDGAALLGTRRPRGTKITNLPR